MRHMRQIFSALAIALIPGLGHAYGPPYVIASATALPGPTQLVMPISRICVKGHMIQVLAVALHDRKAKITVTDSGGVNLYQTGGGKWFHGPTKGVFLATTSPGEPTNAGLKPPATITVTFSDGGVWKAAIAVCVPGLEINSGSADNTAGVSPSHGDGTQIELRPSSNLLTLNEPLFVATVLPGDATDHWTESPGYINLKTLQNRNTVNLAYQIISGVSPTPYLATNSVVREWSAANRSYKTTEKRSKH